MTRRALTKAAWPGVWTNSCCGHPKPRESVESAVVRRVHEELGLELAVVEPLIPGYRYTAVDAAGIMENEICPVYLGIAASDDVAPDPREVAEFRWSPWQGLRLVAEAAPWLLSPWAAEQVSLMGHDRLEVAIRNARLSSSVPRRCRLDRADDSGAADA